MEAAIFFLGAVTVILAAKETFADYLRYRLAVKQKHIESDEAKHMANLKMESFRSAEESPIIGMHNEDVRRARGG